MFSNQSGESSNDISKNILTEFALAVQNITNINLFDYLELNNINYVFRKMMHFTEYMVLTIVLYNFIKVFRLPILVKYIIAFALPAIYAVSDEIHQMYISGRTARIEDIFIDMSGMIVGLLCVILWKRKKHSKGQVLKND